MIFYHFYLHSNKSEQSRFANLNGKPLILYSFSIYSSLSRGNNLNSSKEWQVSKFYSMIGFIDILIRFIGPAEHFFGSRPRRKKSACSAFFIIYASQQKPDDTCPLIFINQQLVNTIAP